MPARLLDPLRATPRVVVVGAGVGGLTTAAWLASEGLEVILLERAATPGGKMARVPAGASGRTQDAGPTVLTMRDVFDALFDRLGPSGDDWLPWRRCTVLARHAWGPGERLDLHADLEASVAAIDAFAGPREAAGYRDFARRAQAIHRTLEGPFLHGTRPTPLSLTARVLRADPRGGLGALLGIAPFTRLWRALGEHFSDPRLRQLFGRYATYCGTSPFVAPATLMLVAHVERQAVWRLEGGVHQLARALVEAGRRQGVRTRQGADVQGFVCRGGRVAGVRLADGDVIEAEAVVFAGDAGALAEGPLARSLPRAVGRPLWAAARSLSAVTWHVEAEVGDDGFALSHHNVFFGPSTRYADEFDAIARGRLPGDPTVYVCAQDRDGAGDAPPRGPERLMCLVNAPAGAPDGLDDQELARCQDAMWNRLAHAGLRLGTPTAPPVRTTPTDFARRFPGSAGALYGPASVGWQASFRREANRSPVPGLYLAGGSVHPGPGVPMAALSGRLAATQLLADLRSTRRFHPVAMPGGMSTR